LNTTPPDTRIEFTLTATAATTLAEVILKLQLTSALAEVTLTATDDRPD
jgi:hypothetical protein